MYIVYTGSLAEVGIMYPRLLKSGDYIGDKNLIVTTAEKATVTASEDCEVYFLGKKDFVRIRNNVRDKINKEKTSKFMKKISKPVSEKSISFKNQVEDQVVPEQSVITDIINPSFTSVSFEESSGGCAVIDAELLDALQPPDITALLGSASENVVPIIPSTSVTPVPVPLTEEYRNRSASEKQTILWERISEATYPDDKLPNDFSAFAVINMANPFYIIKAFTLDSDEMADGRKKVFNMYGAVAKVVFKVMAQGISGFKYTGMFSSGGSGIMRFSLAERTLSDADLYRPAIALKLFVDGQSSINLFAVGASEGQWNTFSAGRKEANRNFFACDFTTSPGPAHLSQYVTPPPIWLFNYRTRPSSWEKAPLWKAATIASDATTVSGAEAVIPDEVIFCPDSDMIDFMEDEVSNSTGMVDFRTHLSAIPVGAVLFKVMARRDGKTDPEEIGVIILDSPIVASKYGDEHLYFQHLQF